MRCPNCQGQYMSVWEKMRLYATLATAFPPCPHCNASLVAKGIHRKPLMIAAGAIGIGSVLLAEALGWNMRDTVLGAMLICGVVGEVLVHFFPTLYYTLVPGRRRSRAGAEHRKKERSGTIPKVHKAVWLYPVSTCIWVCAVALILASLCGAKRPALAFVLLAVCCNAVVLYRVIWQRVNCETVPLVLMLGLDASAALWGGFSGDHVLTGVGVAGFACMTVVLWRRPGRPP